MNKWIWIAAGGAFGSVLRYAIQGWAQRMTTGAFPLGTLVVNVTGCLLLGFLAGLFVGPTVERPNYYLGLSVGVLGGYTTFSTFGLETFHLTTAGHLGLAMLNVGLSCSLGLAAVWIGHRLAEQW